jgi:hypothetical protein
MFSRRNDFFQELSGRRAVKTNKQPRFNADAGWPLETMVAKPFGREHLPPHAV